jgi:uncharacterized oxidoreductase
MSVVSLDGKVVLISGGTSGIGLALARQFDRSGAIVAILGRDATRLATTKATLPRTEVFACDVTDLAQVTPMVAALTAKFGVLDILINNAGRMSDRDFLIGVDPADVEAEVAINLIAPINLTNAVMPLLRKAKEATVVMVTSGYAFAPSSRSPVYSASKAGLRSFTKALRRQVSSLGMTVVEVLPPAVDTPATAHRMGKKLSPDVVAAATLQAIRSKQTEVYLGSTKALPILMRLSPSLTEAIVAKR